MIIKQTAFPRAGLIGNPSDGYYGRTIAFAFTNFQAEVILYETPELEILPNTRDHSVFKSIDGLVEDVKLYGYYGGLRLLKAAVRKFADYCHANDIPLHDRNFTLRYHSNIPHMVGLAGSSAIITACMRALMQFYAVSIPKPELATMVLDVETTELQLSAGLQDRVAQAYQGLVYMNFRRDLMEAKGHGVYEELAVDLLPNLYIAYRHDLSEGSEIVHSDLGTRFKRGDDDVLDAVRQWGDITERVKDALIAGQGPEIGAAMDENFDLRASICQISEGNKTLVKAARSVGASAKFTGSGGAIIGTFEDDEMYAALTAKMDELNIKVFKPAIAAPIE
jgi:glucuronokinase